jgi:ribokinase
MSKPAVVVVGSSNTDMVMRVERLPGSGETLLGGTFGTAAGGKGANQAVAAARAGGAVAFVGRVGADAFGRAAVLGLARERIDTTGVRTDPRAPSGVALIFVSADGENCIAVAGGANLRLSPADVRKARGPIARADILLLQLETPLAAVQTAVEMAARSRVRVILNPAPAAAVPDAILRHVAILTPNQTEAGQMTGIPVRGDADAAEAGRRLLARGVGAVVITLGSRGAYVRTATLDERVPGFPVAAIDTTAAGDVFNGALAVALGEGMALTRAVRFANAAGALAATRLGAQPSAPRRRAIEALLRGETFPAGRRRLRIVRG